MVLRRQAIIVLAIQALFLGSLWADNNNIYALNNNNDNTKSASSIITSLTNKPSNITITTNSNSIYSIPSTSVQLDRFSTNYTIDGKISLNNSKDLITSTIVDDLTKIPT